MNLKEAFRFQNKLQSLTEECLAVLDRTANVVKIKETHLRSKVMPETEDEVVLSVPPGEYSEHVTEMTDYLLFLLGEKEKLSAAVRAAKKDLPLDIDGECGLNSLRQRIAHTFRTMTCIRASEEVIRNGGYGLRFNADGNQITYKCDLRRVTSINFDRNLLKKRCRALSEQTDEISAELDRCIVNTEVSYEAPFDVNAELSELFETFLEEER